MKKRRCYLAKRVGQMRHINLTGGTLECSDFAMRMPPQFIGSHSVPLAIALG